MEQFRYATEVPVRYGDLDPMNHVNNAVYSTFFEEARVSYFDDVLGVPIEEREMVIANIEATFERPVTREDSPVTVGVGVPELGRTSFPIEYEVRGSGERKATGSTRLVCYDGASESSRPIPQRWREELAAFEGLTDA